MSYENALKAAGATLHEFEQFGSYQGEWWAKVTYQGREGWVNGSYGSCSGCDAFQAEFDFEHHDCGKDSYYSPIWSNDFRDNCEICQSIKTRLIAFGKNYLDDIMSQEEAEAHAKRNIEWDSGAHEMVNFIVSHGIGPVG